MKNTLRIGEAIYARLKKFKNVYPLVADEGTTFPFMIYRRSSGYSISTKDGIWSSVANIDVMIAAQSYEESIELADKVLLQLESTRGNVAGFDIWSIRMVDSNETYIENSFVQELKFSVEFSLLDTQLDKACTDM